jgi:hypothetical protein
MPAPRGWSPRDRSRLCVAAFDGREIVYGFGEVDELVLAYATTIHKSQGSEYPAVVIPLTSQHYPMLQRNLVYTGVTRDNRRRCSSPRSVVVLCANWDLIATEGLVPKVEDWLGHPPQQVATEHRQKRAFWERMARAGLSWRR